MAPRGCWMAAVVLGASCMGMGSALPQSPPMAAAPHLRTGAAAPLLQRVARPDMEVRVRACVRARARACVQAGVPACEPTPGDQLHVPPTTTAEPCACACSGSSAAPRAQCRSTAWSGCAGARGWRRNSGSRTSACSWCVLSATLLRSHAVSCCPAPAHLDRGAGAAEPALHASRHEHVHVADGPKNGQDHPSRLRYAHRRAQTRSCVHAHPSVRRTLRRALARALLPQTLSTGRPARPRVRQRLRTCVCVDCAGRCSHLACGVHEVTGVAARLCSGSLAALSVAALRIAELRAPRPLPAQCAPLLLWLPEACVWWPGSSLTTANIITLAGLGLVLVNSRQV